MKSITRHSCNTFFAAVTFAVLGVFSGGAQAASVYFLNIDGILGESTEKAHKDWIAIDSFSWGVGRGGKATFSPFSWIQKFDKSVVPLFMGVASGEIFKSATLDVEKPTGTGSAGVYFQMKFDNVQLTKLNMNGAGGTESIEAALDAYTKVTMTYKQQMPDGHLGPAITGGWDTGGGAATFFGNPLVLEGLIIAGPTNPVPVPAAVWLMGSGLLGLAGVARRNKTV